MVLPIMLSTTTTLSHIHHPVVLLVYMLLSKKAKDVLLNSMMLPTGHSVALLPNHLALILNVPQTLRQNVPNHSPVPMPSQKDHWSWDHLTQMIGNSSTDMNVSQISKLTKIQISFLPLVPTMPITTTPDGIMMLQLA